MKKCLLLLLCMLLPCAALAEAALPLDINTPGFVADPASFTESGYEDSSITVTMERLVVDGATYNVARVKIADPTQLRTALAGPYGTKKTNKTSTMAKNYNAVVAMNGDYYSNRTAGYIVRQGETYRKKPTKSKDMLIVDDRGDFHILVKSDAAQLQAFLASERSIINSFTFGPALVIDGQLQAMPESYEFNIRRKEPRSAIGQTGELEYLLLVVDGRSDDSAGATVEQVAQLMLEQGCTQAYNLDGGNTATMIFGESIYSDKSESAERSISDIIYFATAVDGGLTK